MYINKRGGFSVRVQTTCNLNKTGSPQAINDSRPLTTDVHVLRIKRESNKKNFLSCHISIFFFPDIVVDYGGAETLNPQMTRVLKDPPTVL